MWIRYFVPEDGDDAQHPNVYQSDNNGSLTLAEIKQSFPLSGSFHFRFLKEIDRMTVWMDIVDDNGPLPTHQGSVFVKANRIPTQSVAQSSQNSTAKAAAPTSNGVSSKPARVSQPAPQRAPSEKLLNFHDEIPTPASNPAPAAPAPVATANFVDDNDLLGFSSTSSSSQPVAKASSNADLFGLDTLQPLAPSIGLSPNTGATGNPMGSGFYPSTGSGMGGPRPAGAQMNSMMGAPAGGNMPRPMGGGPGYDPFGSLSMGGPRGQPAPQNPFNRGGMPQRK